MGKIVVLQDQEEITRQVKKFKKHWSERDQWVVLKEVIPGVALYFDDEFLEAYYGSGK